MLLTNLQPRPTSDNTRLERVQQQAKTHNWTSLVFNRQDDRWLITGADAVEVAFCCPNVQSFTRKNGRYQTPVVCIDNCQITGVIDQLLSKGSPVFLIDTETGELQEFYPQTIPLNADSDVLRLGFTGERNLPAVESRQDEEQDRIDVSPVVISFREAMATAIANTCGGVSGLHSYFGHADDDEWGVFRPTEEAPF